MDAITSSTSARSSLRDPLLLGISSAILLPFLLLPLLLFLLRRRLPSSPSSPTPSRLAALTTPLLLLSLLFLGTAGATSLAGQAGSGSAATLARVASFLGVLTADLYLIFLARTRFSRVGGMLVAIFAAGVISAILLLVSFARRPTNPTIPAIRAASHILFDLFLSAVFFQDLRATQLEVEGSVVDHQAANKSQENDGNRFSLPTPWRPRSAPQPAKWENGDGSSSRSWSDASPTEWQSFRLLVLQSLSILISILSVALPVAYDYTYLTAFSTQKISPTLFGTTTSPLGFVLLNTFVFVRWSGFTLDLALPNGPIPLPQSTTPPPFVSQRFSVATTGTDNSGRFQSARGTQDNTAVEPHPCSNLSQSTPQLPSSKLPPPPRKNRSSSSLSALSPPTFSNLPPRIETSSPFKGLGINLQRRPSLSALQLSFESQLQRETTDVSTYSANTLPSGVPKTRGLDIGVVGYDPFSRDPSVEAVEEMWRKRLGSLGEEQREASGSLSRAMVRVSGEEEGSSEDGPTGSTFFEEFSDTISHRSPTPAMLNPSLRDTPTIDHPYAYPQLYPDPFPAPGTYPRPLFRTHASAPPSSTPASTHPSTSHLRTNLPLGSWSGRPLGTTSPFLLKRIKKARGKFGSLGSLGSTRASSHSDESFSCVGEVEKGFGPRTKVVEKVEDFEQLAAGAGGLKALHLPGLVRSLKRKGSWWRGSMGSGPETPTPVGRSRPFSDYQLSDPPLRLSPIGSFELPRSSRSGSGTPKPRSLIDNDLTPPANPPRSPPLNSTPTSPDPTPSSPEPEIDADETTRLSKWNLPLFSSRLSHPTTPPHAHQPQRTSLPSSPSSRASLPSSPSSPSGYSYLHHGTSEFSPSAYAPSTTGSERPLLDSSPRHRSRKSSHDDGSSAYTNRHSIDSHLPLGRLLERSKEAAGALERTGTPLSESESGPSTPGFASLRFWREERAETPASSCFDQGEEGRC